MTDRAQNLGAQVEVPTTSEAVIRAWPAGKWSGKYTGKKEIPVGGRLAHFPSEWKKSQHPNGCKRKQNMVTN